MHEILSLTIFVPYEQIQTLQSHIFCFVYNYNQNTGISLLCEKVSFTKGTVTPTSLNSTTSAIRPVSFLSNTRLDTFAKHAGQSRGSVKCYAILRDCASQ